MGVARAKGVTATTAWKTSADEIVEEVVATIRSASTAAVLVTCRGIAISHASRRVVERVAVTIPASIVESRAICQGTALSHESPREEAKATGEAVGIASVMIERLLYSKISSSD